MISKTQKIEDFNKNLVTAFILMEMQNVMKNCPKIVKQSHFLRMATTNLRHHSAFFVQRKFICLFYVLLDLFSVWAFNWCPVQEIGTMQDYLNCVLSKGPLWGFWPRMHFSRKARVQGLTNNLWSFSLPNKHKLTWRGAQTSHSQMCQYFHQGKPQYWIWICPPSFWILWSSKLHQFQFLKERSHKTWPQKADA